MDRGVDVSELPERLTGVMHFCPIDQNLLHITDKPLPNDGDDARRPDWVDRPNPMAEGETEETSDAHEADETSADSDKRSVVRKVREQGRILQRDADEVGGRAHDTVFQVQEVRQRVEGRVMRGGRHLCDSRAARGGITLINVHYVATC